ncbi:unnamed protein product [Dibothriocephalus latus]|uniref:Uncharacterized protein n=1 Tax=Dibothriocephalus latus TaxID=60516 RepID=A0A3P7L326_DIBLA|nr:unnamed protein product [Dibothriocephalus latus]
MSLLHITRRITGSITECSWKGEGGSSRANRQLSKFVCRAQLFSSTGSSGLPSTWTITRETVSLCHLLAPSDDNEDDDDDLEAELLMELENMETKGGAAPDTSDPKERGREEEKKDAGSGEGSVISVDDELERELLAEIEEEEAAAAADSKKSS